MNPKASLRRRLVLSVVVAASAALAVSIGVRLSGYGVPVSLLVACSSAFLSTAVSLLFRVVDAWSTTTLRCRQAGCDFHVRLSGTSTAEIRHWQEIAAAHPHRSA